MYKADNFIFKLQLYNKIQNGVDLNLIKRVKSAE